MIHHVITYLCDTARKYPDKIAFSDAENALSYGELYRQTSAVATAINRRLCGRTRQPVFVVIGRDVASIAAFFGVAASGCFYVPIDPTLPDQRLSDIYETVKPQLVITTQRDTRSLPFEAQTVALEEFLHTAPEEALLRKISEQMLDTDPLYCNFTSGSTGVPKGVLISHRSVIDMAEQFTKVFGFDETAVFGNQAPFDFDVSVKDIYIAVKNGATVHILEKSLFSIPKRLIERMNQHRVNTLIWSVSAMKILSALRTFKSMCPEYVRTVMFSGEVLPCKVLNDWREHLVGAKFVNLYGPTEITCNCTYYPIEREFANDESIPIGRAFPNTGILLLDGDDEVTQPGCAGEICVTGTCLALGYYADAERTAAAFCQNPLQSAWPQKIYRTGDLGQWNEAGELVFLGRADTQVKHMGFRIELGEIEIAANAVGFVNSACCLYDHKKEQLCLFYSATERDDKALLAALREVLPAFMIPKRVFYFEKMPENRTGKIDRASLRLEYLAN